MAKLSTIKLLQAKKFKQNYISEVDIAVSFIKDKVKSDELLTREDVEEAKAMFGESLDKILELDEGLSDASDATEPEPSGYSIAERSVPNWDAICFFLFCTKKGVTNSFFKCKRLSVGYIMCSTFIACYNYIVAY